MEENETVPELDVNKCQSCQNNDADGMHSCPFQEDVYGNNEANCNCCADCRQQCCNDI